MGREDASGFSLSFSVFTTTTMIEPTTIQTLLEVGMLAFLATLTFILVD
jgi:hypothetical protein